MIEVSDGTTPLRVLVWLEKNAGLVLSPSIDTSDQPLGRWYLNVYTDTMAERDFGFDWDQDRWPDLGDALRILAAQA